MYDEKKRSTKDGGGEGVGQEENEQTQEKESMGMERPSETFSGSHDDAAHMLYFADLQGSSACGMNTIFGVCV